MPETRRGAEKWGGHAYRRGGVHLYAALGFTREQIKELARHTSSAVDDYLDGANLLYVKRLIPQALGTCQLLPSRVQDLVIPEAFPNWTHVRMARGGKVHRCIDSSGRTLCGWPWAASVSRCLSAPELLVSCYKCLRRASRQVAASSSSTGPSPLSSSSSSAASSCSDG